MLVGTPAEWMVESKSPPELAEESDLDARFAMLAQRQSHFMFKVAIGLLRDPHDAEDAVQEALLKLYRTRGWLHMDDEKAFLARTVWRVALDLAASRRGVADENASINLACGSPSPEQLADQGDRRALVRELIECLSEELRQPLILCAIEEMTSREVAVILGLTEGAVRTRVMRARAELKRQFEIMQRSRTAQQEKIR